MNTESQREGLRWKKKPVPELARLAWPITVSMLSFSVMTMVDTIFVGRLGAGALAGVGLGGVLSFTLLCFGMGLLRGLKVLVSQAAGAGRLELVPGYRMAGLATAAALGLVAALAGQLLGPLVLLLAGDGVTSGQAAAYLAIACLGAPFVLGATALREIRYGLGDSQGPMRAALLANLANVPLNALFIFGLGWGVRGAAAATALASAVELGLLAAGLRRADLRPALLDRRRLGELWRLGLPLGAEFLLDVSAFTALAALVARAGEVQMAAHQIALQLSRFVFLPAVAVGDASSILTGQAVGAGEDGLVRRLGRLTLGLASGYTVGVGLALALFAEPLVALFSPDPAVRAAAATLLRAAAVLNGAFGAHVVARSVLRGTGDVRFPAVITVAFAWTITPPLALWLGLMRGWGALGGWVGLCAEIVLGAALLWWRLEGGHWQRAARASRERIGPVAGEGLAPAPTV